MLVTDPKQRATMQEVMVHPWMIKGSGVPPENHLPHREPLTLPLDPEVIAEMTGFSFGPPEAIKAQLAKIIESEDYQRAVRLLQKERELSPPPKDIEKKRGFGFDFYKRRGSGNSRDTLTAPSSEGLQLGADPLNAFSPLVSIYYLVREKQDRKRQETPATGPSAPPKDSKPEIPAPKEAHTNSSTYEMPGEQATGGRTRPRARTHGEDEAPEHLKNATLSPTAAVHPQDHRTDRAPKKESAAAGLLRRFSTRRRKEPERLDKDRSHPPAVQVHSPAEAPSLRKSFSIRRSRPDRHDDAVPRLRSGSSQPQHSDLLSPPLSAGAGMRGAKKGLGRSTSVNSAEFQRRRGDFGKEPPPTSGSDQSGPPAENTSERRAGTLSSRSVSMRAKPLGHARRESIQARRARREAETRGERNPVPEETDAELGDHSGLSNERLEREDPDLAKPVFLKGMFSVSTTSTKPVPEIRADIKRVLRQLGADYTEIRGGFSCRHAPSIDLKKVTDRPSSPQGPWPPQTPGGHRRRFSLGLRSGRSKEDLRDGTSSREHEKFPPTPRTPGGKGREKDRDDRSYSNSDLSDDSDVREPNGGSSSKRVPAGETRTHVQSDLGGSMVLEFEIFVVKIPVISLHGIQFKRLSGNTWQYKNMADQILKELRL